MTMTENIKTTEIIQNRRKANMAAFLQYTILFCILVAGIYAVFIISHKTFVQKGDATTQGFFWMLETKHQLEKLFRGEGLQLWSWSRMLGMATQTTRFWDPFNWIASAFPEGYFELGYTVATLLRIYCGGAAFLALMRYTGLGVYASVFGAAAYSFSGYTILNGLVHADFLINVYLFPLLVLSVEFIYRNRTPAFFSLVTALYLVSNFYYAYMAAISIILYILLRYFAYRKFELKDFAANTGRFVFYGIVGICIGSIQFLSDAAALSGASSGSVADKFSLLFDRSRYINIGRILVGTGNVKNSDIVGWTVIIIMLLAIAFIGLRISKTPAVMSLIMLAGMMIPAVCTVYNGFAYPSVRWVFALELFAAWAAAAELDEARIFSRLGICIGAAALGITAFLTLGLYNLFNLGLGRRAIVFTAIQMLGGVLFLILLVCFRKEGQLRRLSKVLILVIFAGTLTAAWTVSFSDNKARFHRNNKISKMLNESPQRAGALIKDDEFYRVDQVGSILYSHQLEYPPNETLWWQTRSIYGYNTRIPAEIYEFNRLAGNNYGYSKRVFVISNDNRTGLDYLYGVKYFLGDDLKNEKYGADKFTGYGFEEHENLDGVRVYRSKYDVSLGYVFDKYIHKSEFEKLSYAEREQALLQAVVMPDDIELPEVTLVEADDIRTAVTDVRYTVTESDGAVLTGDSIVVDKDGGSITIEPEDVENSQLLVSVTGLLRDTTEGQSGPFELHISNEYVEETASNTRTNQSIPNIEDYTLNLGYYDDYRDGKVRISFSSPGVYSYDDIRLFAMDADLFDDCIEELGGRRYEINSFSDTMVEGTVKSENDGILYLSIIEPDRWECSIDGKKARIIKNTDIAFAGVEVPAGQHTITLRFNNRITKVGAIFSVLGLVVLAADHLIRRRRNNTYIEADHCDSIK